MKWLAIILLLILVCTNINGQEKSFVYTDQMAARCKLHLSQRGYNYDTYYSVNQDTRPPTKAGDPYLIMEMHVAIKASSNGHILLSQERFPSDLAPVYEIVVGGGSNRFTELRRTLKRNAKASRHTENILSSSEYRGFYIQIYSHGLIQFGQEGASLPLLSYHDISPLDIKYYSFAAWNGVEARFLYDCPPPIEPSSGSNTTFVHNSTKIERNLTASEQLKKDKLQDRSPFTPPLPTMNVSLVAKVSNVGYNSFKAKLTTRLTLLTVWEDQGLAWNPDKFNGLLNVTYRQGQIWRPTLHVYNSDKIDGLRTNGYELITVKSDGSASFHFKATIDTWCFSYNTFYSRWPHDEYSCNIVIRALEAHERIVLSFLQDTDAFLNFTDSNDYIENEWILTKTNQYIMDGEDWNKIYQPDQENISHKSDRLVITLNIKRRPTNYNIVFYTPLIVLMTFILMSFWSEPLQMSRIWFYNGAIVIICAGLCFIEYLIPCHTVPTILILYISVLYGVLAALVLNVVMMTSGAEAVCKSVAVQNLLSARWFRVLFCMPVVKACSNYNRVNDGFSHQEDDDESVVPSNGAVDEMLRDTAPPSEREEIASALDKTMFVVLSVMFAAMLGAHY